MSAGEAAWQARHQTVLSPVTVDAAGVATLLGAWRETPPERGGPVLPWKALPPAERKRLILECAASASTRKALAEAVAERVPDATVGGVKRWIQRQEKDDTAFKQALNGALATAKRARHVSRSDTA